MGLFNPPGQRVPKFSFFLNSEANTLKSRLLLTLLPSLVFILLVAGYVTYRLSNEFISTALMRNVKVQNLAQAHELEKYLEECRRDLLSIAQSPATEENLRDFILERQRTAMRDYPFLAFVSLANEEHILLSADKDGVARLGADDMGKVKPAPLDMYALAHHLKPGEAAITAIQESLYPFPTAANANHRLQLNALHLVAPTADGRGYLVLGVDARSLRNILSLYNSPQSPIWAYTRSQEVRYSYLFDTEGWILFQSEDPKRGGMNLGTDAARGDYEGAYGRSDLACAFRPKAAESSFWKMIAEVGDEQYGAMPLEDYSDDSYISKLQLLAYAPIRFRSGPDAEPKVWAGVAFVDRSRLTMVAGYKHLDAMLYVTLCAVALASLVIYLASLFLTRPMYRLVEAVKERQVTGKLDLIELPFTSYETAAMQEAVNSLLLTIHRQVDEIRIRDLRLESAAMRERIELEAELQALDRTPPEGPLGSIIGIGPLLDTWRESILKAAKVDVDVLIIGETGTGKQLTAEAIHTASRRADKPFISINCGELDENLLMDALFGHVKGAFTEAKEARTGAFMEANGGVLFLDEIQVASPKVQQALLRALAMRKIRRLGSDREEDVDVRIIAATNVDLTVLIAAKLFREDLYFRLKVIAIHTPPLRDHLPNIPLLTMHFLREAEAMAGKENLGLSKGALEKLMNHSWPGNIRELRNCITRAAVMCGDETIQAQDLLLESAAYPGLPASAPSDTVHASDAEPDPDRDGRLADRKKGAQGALDDSGGPAPAPPFSPPQAPPPVSRDDGAQPGTASSTPPAKSKPPAADRSRPPAANPLSALHPRQAAVLPALLERREITRSAYQELAGGVSSRTAVNDLRELVEKGLLERHGKGPSTRYTTTRACSALASGKLKRT